jgi:hypothetical protein
MVVLLEKSWMRSGWPMPTRCESVIWPLAFDSG